MVRIALIGAGFIGKVHAANLARHPGVEFRWLIDADEIVGRPLAERYGTNFHHDVAAALTDELLDAVLIATPAATHPEMIRLAAGADKAIFCEKPLGVELEQVDSCLSELAGFRRPLLIGFNRRFDPHHRALAEAVKRGEIGQVELINITSRDPGPPPLDHLRATPGGVFYETMCHDFDMARWLLAEEPTEVYAAASSLLEPAVNPDRDPDTAVAVLKTSGGALCQINVSRRSVYGYDQRIEVFGSKGMLQSGNPLPTTVRRFGAEGIREDVLMTFFTDRYRDAYRLELEHFVTVVERDGSPEISAWDGRQCLAISLAALASARSGRPLALEPGGEKGRRE